MAPHALRPDQQAFVEGLRAGMLKSKRVLGRAPTGYG